MYLLSGNARAVRHKVEIDLSSELHLFRGISHTKKGEKLRVTPISYTRLREIVKAKLEEIEVDGSKYGLHTFRAGGATAAANNGIPDRLFKQHGRWKSETAKDGYILDSQEARLQVSRSLGIW